MDDCTSSENENPGTSNACKTRCLFFVVVVVVVASSLFVVYRALNFHLAVIG